jgi:cation:H+ antiporter
MGADLLWLIAGLAMVVKGGSYFVSSSVRLAELWRIPRVVIGSTLMSLATTTPEITVSIVSGLKGEPGLAVGNAVGSCICNFSLILGLLAVMKNVETHPQALRMPLCVMTGCGLLVFGLSFDLRLGRGQGLLLLLLGLLYFGYDFWRHQRAASPTEEMEASELERERLQRRPWAEGLWGTLLYFLLGAGLVILGSKLLVDGAVQVAEVLGVPSIMIGLTVVALGTSLPELVTAITSSRQNVSDLAVGNLLGANIANLTLVMGSAAAMHELRMDRVVQLLNFPGLLAAILLGFLFLSSGRRLTRIEGAGLMGYYVFYILILTAVTLATRG